MAVLHYFQGRGLGEIVRLVLCVSDVKFTESFVKTREDFLRLANEGKLKFKQLPMLEMDGKCLVQTTAIVRYIAETSGMTPATAEEKYRADMLFAASRDLLMAFLSIGFKDEEEVLSAAKEKTLPKMLPILEAELVGNSSGYVVGDSLSIADAGLLETFLMCLDYFGQDVFAKYPNIQKYVKHLKSLEKVQHYLTNIRQRPNDKDYIREVQLSLGQIE